MKKSKRSKKKYYASLNEKYRACLQNPRFCFNCKNQINLDNYLITQDPKLSIKKSLNYWLSDIKKFYCCDCYAILKKST